MIVTSSDSGMLSMLAQHRSGLFSKQDQNVKSTVKGELIQYQESQPQFDIMPYKEMVMNIVKEKLSNIWI